MGWTDADSKWVYMNRSRFNLRTDNKASQRRLVISPFYMDIYPVTARCYARFRRIRRPGRSNHPVNNVNWHDARAFAKWVGGDLPTDAQWERAARGDRNCRYPWGDQPPDETRANFEGRYGDTTPVGQFAPNPFGLYDMAGNVYDWCLDWYSYDYVKTAPVRDPAGPENGTHKILRGASYGRWADDDQALVHCAFKHKWEPNESSAVWGFRCVINLHPDFTTTDEPSAPERLLGFNLGTETFAHEEVDQRKLETPADTKAYFRGLAEVWGSVNTLVLDFWEVTCWEPENTRGLSLDFVSEALLGLQREAARRRCRLIVANPRPSVRKLLNKTQLDRVLEIQPPS